MALMQNDIKSINHVTHVEKAAFVFSIAMNCTKLLGEAKQDQKWRLPWLIVH